MSFIAAASAAVAITTGVVKNVQAKKQAKEQDKQAAKLQADADNQRQKQDQYGQNMLANARRKAMGNAAGFDEAKESIEGQAAGGVSQVRKSAKSSMDVLNASSRVSSNASKKLKDLNIQNMAARSKNEDKVTGIEGKISDAAGARGKIDAERGDAVQTAADQNRADATNALLSGFNTAAGSFATIKGGNAKGKSGGGKRVPKTVTF